jgi:hypothetical protein
MRTIYKGIRRYAQSAGIPEPKIEDASPEGMLAAALTN